MQQKALEIHCHAGWAKKESKKNSERDHEERRHHTQRYQEFGYCQDYYATDEAWGPGLPAVVKGATKSMETEIFIVNPSHQSTAAAEHFPRTII